MVIVEVLQMVSVLVLGLLIGSLLTEATILVPYWRKMEPAEFLRLHSSMGPSLFRYFAPLTVAGTLIPMITGVVTVFVTGRIGLPVIVSVLTAMMLIIYFIYFKAANKSFEVHSVSVEAIPEELQRWATWHWLRVVIGLSAFSLSIAVLTLG